MRVPRARARCAATSSVPSATRASPCACVERGTRGRRGASVRSRAPSPRSASASARSTQRRRRPRPSSGSSTSTRVRESSGAITSNDGFSVVAPIRIDRAALDVRQERVLLRLVEAVDLVDEEDGRLAGATQLVLGVGDDLAQLLHAVQHGRERDDRARRSRRASSRASVVLPGAGRAPEDQRLAGAPLASRSRRSDPGRAGVAGRRTRRACAAACARRAARGAGVGRRGGRAREQLGLPRHARAG